MTYHTSNTPAQLETPARRVIAHIDKVLAAFQANDYFVFLPAERINAMDYRRLMRKRESAVMILNAIENGQEPNRVDVGQLSRDDGWSTREVFLHGLSLSPR